MKVFDDMFRVNLYRGSMSEVQADAAKLAERIGVADRNVASNIKKLKERGILIRHGSPKNGYWEIIQ